MINCPLQGADTWIIQNRAVPVEGCPRHILFFDSLSGRGETQWTVQNRADIHVHSAMRV